MRAASCDSKRLYRVFASLASRVASRVDSAMACRLVETQSFSLASLPLTRTEASRISSSIVTLANGSRAGTPINQLLRARANPCSALDRSFAAFRKQSPSALHRASRSADSSRSLFSSSPSPFPARISPSSFAGRALPPSSCRPYPRAVHSDLSSSEHSQSEPSQSERNQSERQLEQSQSELSQSEASAEPAAEARADDTSTSAPGSDASDASEPTEEVRKSVLVVRRRRAGGVGLAGLAAGGEGVVWSDLLTVPGVGPRNLEKLKARGFSEVASLTQLYRDKFAFQEASQGRTAMQAYLQSHVGITRKDHAARITDFVSLRVAQEGGGGDGAGDGGEAGGGEGEGAGGKAGAGEGEGGAGKRGSSAGRGKRRLTFCVEGNISVGKTSFLERIVGEAVELHDLVEVVPEPVARWQSVGQERFNILEAFYEEPERYAYTFQNYVFVTRMMQERESAGGVRPIRLMERSVFSDRMVFVRAVHEAKWMSEMEVSIYDSWFDPVVSALPGLVPDGFIYLRANPTTCHQRLLQRARGEEAGVSLDYLVGLHEKHEQWLLPVEQGGVLGGVGVGGVVGGRPRVAVVEPEWMRGGRGGKGREGAGQGEDEPPEIIKGRVFALEGGHLHSSIQQVPALVLDCDAQIDLTHDRDAKELYTQQVQAFFDFVQRRKEQQKQRQRQWRQAGGISPDSPLIIPSRPSLSMPQGVDFNPSSFLRS